MNHPPSFDLQCQDKQLRRAAIWDIILEVPTGMPVKSLRNEILMAGCSDEVLLSNSSADILDERRPWNNKILVLPTVPKICLKIWGPKKIGHCLFSSKWTLCLAVWIQKVWGSQAIVGVPPWSPTREHLESFGHLWFPVCLVSKATLAIRTPVCLHQTECHVKDSAKTPCMWHASSPRNQDVGTVTYVIIMCVHVYVWMGD